MTTLQKLMHFAASPWGLAGACLALLTLPAYGVALWQWRARRILAIRLRLEEGWQNTRMALTLLSLTRPKNPPSPRFRRGFLSAASSNPSPAVAEAAAGPKPKQRRFYLRYIGRTQ